MERERILNVQVSTNVEIDRERWALNYGPETGAEISQVVRDTVEEIVAEHFKRTGVARLGGPVI